MCFPVLPSDLLDEGFRTMRERQKLTKRLIDATMACAGECFVWDSELAGFGLRVRVGGSKTFIAQHRAGGGRSGQSRCFTIGRCGVLTVEEARLEARKVLLAAAQGDDPARKRKARRGEITIAQLSATFGKEGLGHKLINRIPKRGEQ